MARVPGAVGTVGVDDLNKIIAALQQANIPSSQFGKLLPALIPAGIGAGATAAVAAGPGVLSGLAGFGQAVGADYVAERLVGGLTGAPQPAYVPADPGGSKYLVTPDQQKAYIEFAAKENFKRSLYNYIAGAVGLPQMEPLERPEAYAERSAALTSRQMAEATEREIALERAKRGYDLAIQQVASQAELGKQRLQSLGDVQRQRVESGYGSVTNMFSDVMKNVVARERFENNATLAELAKPV
jgi:hypothetical protein